MTEYIRKACSDILQVQCVLLNNMSPEEKEKFIMNEVQN